LEITPNTGEMGHTSKASRTKASLLPCRIRLTCKNKGEGLYERFFEYKFEAQQKIPDSANSNTNNTEVAKDSEGCTGVLNCLVLANSICVLTSPYESDHTSAITSVSFHSATGSVSGLDLSTDAISGKKKKGARKITAGHTMCTFHYDDGSNRKMITPVGGQVLELNNEQLQSTPLLIQSEPLGRGHIAVILPESDLLPSLEDQRENENENGKQKQPVIGKEYGEIFSLGKGKVYNDNNNNNNSNDNDNQEGGKKRKAAQGKGPCFAFSKGSCLRGEKCMFLHIPNGQDIETFLQSQSQSPEKKQKKESISTGIDKDTGACYAFMKGDCSRGDLCKFSHTDTNTSTNTDTDMAIEEK
jgi:hypothetical protein